MKLLAFDTSIPGGGVALLVDGAVIAEVRLYAAQSHSRHALDVAATLMDSAGLNWPDLTHLGVAVGPGAFTGVRVGLTIVKALAWDLKLPVAAVDTLEALALGAWSGEQVDCLMPLVDARMGEVYTARFRPVVGVFPERLSADEVIPPAVAAQSATGCTLLCGEGARRYREAFADPRFLIARGDRLLSSPAAVALLAARAADQGELTTAQEIAAVYLREAVHPR
jgi:tRNA threonylcarbamoyladenosine biosynthesis protein TsaB